MGKNNIVKITPGYIEHQLTNVGQIVFEVTDACNLNCTYCGYGKLYEGYDYRQSKKINAESAIALIDYCVDKWGKGSHVTPNQIVYISFYGGEPLLNMPFVKQIVDYIEQLPPLDRVFVFSMTTNALLLGKHIEYLVEKRFNLLISLDGDEHGDSYRVDHSGQSSFKKVYDNIQNVQDKFPEFFDKKVMFNSVLHNRNSAVDVTNFIRTNFGKMPELSPLNPSWIDQSERQAFEEMYVSFAESIQTTTNFDKLYHDNFLQLPIVNELIMDVFTRSGNVFKDYNELLTTGKRKTLPTGTCAPFGKKIFLTVNNKILVCERIPQNFVAGHIEHNQVYIDYELLADTYNEYYRKIQKLCGRCANMGMCRQCLFQSETLLTDNPSCDGFMTKEIQKKDKERLNVFLRSYPGAYSKILKEVVIY